MLEVIEGQTVIFLDSAGLVKAFNLSAERLTKYKTEEIIGKHFSVFYQQEDLFNYIPEVFIQQAVAEGTAQNEGWLQKKGTTVFWSYTCMVAEFNEKNEVTGFSLFIRDETEKYSSKLAIDEYIRKLALKKKELDQFVYIASHDLQEPLMNVRNFVELFRMEYLESFDQDAHLYMLNIDKATEKMRNLIKGLLDHSRLSIDQAKVAIDCNLLLDDLLPRLSGIIKSKGAKISCANLPVLNGFESPVKQLFGHLIGNALKFSKPNENPKIEITASKEGSYWRFEFADNGIGIEDRFKEKIFVMFQRLHGAEIYPGDGVGLTHCRKIVELHGGRIWVESVLGEGSKFCFTLSAN
jgi:PAS domain S-box-containing protein